VLLRRCPTLHLLATSRQPLGVAGETVRRLSPLALPDPRRLPPLEQLPRYGAIQLFLERVRASRLGFALTTQDAWAVVQICRRLDGIPLAIELAAARIGVLSVMQIEARLDDCFRLLAGGSRTDVPHHRTLRAAIDWSYDLLAPAEQALFRRLSVFAGGWTPEAAEAIGDGDVLERLAQLVVKSLVVVDDQGEQARYRLLETVRQYGLDKLAVAGESTQTRDRHLAGCLELAVRVTSHPQGADRRAWLDEVEIEYDNLREALRWASESNQIELGLRLAGALGRFWIIRGYPGEGRRWLGELLAADTQGSAARAAALLSAGSLASLQGDSERAMALGEQGLALHRALGDRAGVAGALQLLGTERYYQDEMAEATALLGEGLALYRELEDRSGTSQVLLVLGNLASTQGDHQRAVRLYQGSLELQQGLGSERLIATSLLNLADALYYLGDYAQARQHTTEALRLFWSVGDRRAVATGLEGIAGLAVVQGQADQAARLMGTAEALREEIAVPIAAMNQADYENIVAAVRGELTDGAFAAAWAAGRAISVEEAISEILEAPPGSR
jgi:non-specific serine/threonine protein kinase